MKALMFLGAALLTVATGSLAYELPPVLMPDDVSRAAREHRAEVVAARARAAAADQRPAIVSALEDPVISPAIDHYPFEMMEEENGRRYDWSIAVEQAFPLSGVRGHRRRSAQADAARLNADAQRAALDVEWDALKAFFMLLEARNMRLVLDQQLTLARQVVDATRARYRAAGGTQADALRSEVELARLVAQRATAEATVRAAEAMLNVSLGRDPLAPLPELKAEPRTDAPPPTEQVIKQALDSRPELRSGAAEIERAEADRDVMESMYLPMAMVKAGRAETMAEGPGGMLMIGISVPIWRGRVSAGVAEAEAMREMARADLQAMLRMVAGEAAAAREEVVAAQIGRRSLLGDVLPRAQAAFTSALASYASGQAPLTIALDSAKALWAIQGEAVMADTRLGIAWARLHRTTGHPP